jgi:hypothetical protein
MKISEVVRRKSKAFKAYSPKEMEQYLRDRHLTIVEINEMLRKQ